MFFEKYATRNMGGRLRDLDADGRPGGSSAAPGVVAYKVAI